MASGETQTAEHAYWIANWEATEVEFDFSATECEYTHDYGMGITGTLNILDTNDAPFFNYRIQVVLSWPGGASMTVAISCLNPIECDRKYNLWLEDFTVGTSGLDWTGATGSFNNGALSPVLGCNAPAPPIPEESSMSSASKLSDLM